MLILSITRKKPKADHSVKPFSGALPQMPLSLFQHELLYLRLKMHVANRGCHAIYLYY